MWNPLLISLGLFMIVQAAVADTTRLTEKSGRWVCQPDNPAWPQVLIDFSEDAYRRCDQNTCVTYEIRDLQADTSGASQTVQILFGESSHMTTEDRGGVYRERLERAGMTTKTTGVCAYRGDGDIYEPQQ